MMSTETTNVEAFIRKWKASELKERSASQSHFIDLCALLGVESPTEADQKGEWYCFERGASKTIGGDGWADVWKRGHFGWEYKGKRKNLDLAFAQLQQYAVALENPPLLVVSDMDRIVIHTNWTNTVSEVREIMLDDLTDPHKRDLLRWVFEEPERLRPSKTIDALTREAADKFAGLAITLRERGHDPQDVAHFVNRLVFCMFAEDINLLPRHMFSTILERAFNRPHLAQDLLGQLFAAMKDGGLFGVDEIEWFNGGLFDDAAAIPLKRDDLKTVWSAAELDWSDIDPSIFGTLFERGLDPSKRSQLGAHYTDPEKIMMIVRPVIIEPLQAEWQLVRSEIEAQLGKAEAARQRRPETQGEARRVHAAARRQEEAALRKARELHTGFIERLRSFRVLDPACGSGNFLYLALLSLKDLEHRANLDVETLGLERPAPSVGPEAVLGIEINPYAAELARVTVWIGEIQWMRKNGFSVSRKPILKPLQTIECRDALLNDDGSQTSWPPSDVIIGNPPFLGAKSMKRALGIEQTEKIRSAFSGDLPGFTDLVCYWFEKARKALEIGNTKASGLVATNSIAKNTNLPVLRRISNTAHIFFANSDMPWIIDGASVRVAVICFSKCKNFSKKIVLDNEDVAIINANLTTGIDVSSLKTLDENNNTSFVGIQKSGPFDIPAETARDWLNSPTNPNGKSNAIVLRPTVNGNDLTSTRRDIWLIDFPRGLSEQEASLWERPFQHLLGSLYDEDDAKLGTLRDVRASARDIHPRQQWWTTYWPRPEVRKLLESLNRFIVTPMTSEHRIFVWVKLPCIPDNNAIIIARDDNLSFGVIHSKIHECWSTTIGNRMGVGNQRRYNPETIFKTFPFPEGLTPNIPADSYADDPRAQAIAEAVEHLNELRENWLNPPDLVRREPEVVEGYPDRLIPVDEKAAAELKKRTLTNLYNQRPAWLDNAHRALDEAVATAYGWPADLSDEEILERLLVLNLKRSARNKK